MTLDFFRFCHLFVIFGVICRFYCLYWFVLGSRKSNKSNQYLDTLGYNYDFSILDARANKDVDPDAPICIGMDYNANIAPTALTRFLPFGRSYFVVDTLYIRAEKFPFRDTFSISTSGIL